MSTDEDVCVRNLHAMASGTPADFEATVHPAAVNRESQDEPPDTRGTGPAAWQATARWLRSAFSDLAWEVHEIVHDGDLVVLHTTMTARQTGTFVTFGPDGRPVVAFPPTGKIANVTQTHWFRTADGKVIEHWANRDDLGMGQQLGWTPPSPVYLVRMLVAGRAARRAA